jgi:hypothetical protein
VVLSIWWRFVAILLEVTGAWQAQGLWHGIGRSCYTVTPGLFPSSRILPCTGHVSLVALLIVQFQTLKCMAWVISHAILATASHAT